MSKSIWDVKKVSYNKVGTKNKASFPQEFIDICKMTQEDLKIYLMRELVNYYDPNSMELGDGYLIAKGDCPVVLTAHMDTVHKEPVKTYWGNINEKGQHIISSDEGIGGDDRCGVYMILNILATTELKPTIIFCEDEEIGGVGSSKFVMRDMELEGIKFFIELDRANGNDLVFYDDANEEFHDWCEEITGYRENFGSFSDISNLCPHYGISGVNISCGYYNAHTTNEYVILEEMFNGIDAAVKLMNAATELEEPFEYKRYKPTYSSYSSYYGSSYGKDWDKWFDRVSTTATEKKKVTAETFTVEAIFYYLDEHYNEIEETVEADSKLGAIAIFLMNHPEMRWADVLDYEFL